MQTRLSLGLCWRLCLCVAIVFYLFVLLATDLILLHFYSGILLRNFTKSIFSILNFFYPFSWSCSSARITSCTKVHRKHTKDSWEHTPATRRSVCLMWRSWISKQWPSPLASLCHPTLTSVSFFSAFLVAKACYFPWKVTSFHEHW